MLSEGQKVPCALKMIPATTPNSVCFWIQCRKQREEETEWIRKARAGTPQAYSSRFGENSFLYMVGGQEVVFELREHEPVSEAYVAHEQMTHRLARPSPLQLSERCICVLI